MTGDLRSVLAGTGSRLPSRVFTNEEFLALVDTSDAWIRARTGIRERRFAAPTETSASLGLDASRCALEMANLDASDLDLVICSTVTPDFMTPSNANLIQTGLGCRSIPSFDILAACTGFLYALSIADQYIRAGTAKHVLVVGAEVLTRIVDFTDRNSCILFGDGAGAAILSAARGSDRGIRTIGLHADGDKQKLIQVPGMVTRQVEGEKPLDFMTIQGREVFKFAVLRMEEEIEKARADAALMGLEIDLLIPHQVNRRIIDHALGATNFPAEKVMVNLDRYGNTSAASIPIALDEAMRSGRAKPGQTVLFIAFGGGLTWGSALVTL